MSEQKPVPAPVKAPTRAEEEKLAALDRQAKALEEETKRLQGVVEELTRNMEKTRIAEYVNYLNRPWKLLWNNFLIGIARGLGSTIGLAIILGIVIYVLQELIVLNLPVISDGIIKFITMIQENLQYVNTKG